MESKENLLLSLEWSGVKPSYLEEFLNTNTGLTNPYHNLQHALRVAESTIRASHFMKLDTETQTSLAIAGLFHDWGHPGVSGNDHANVTRAADKVYSIPTKDSAESDINVVAANIILGTEFPLPQGFALTPEQEILRDADYWHCALLSESDWLALQIGLAKEMGKNPAEWFARNLEFVKTVPGLSPWGKHMASEYRDTLIRRVVMWANRLAE